MRQVRAFSLVEIVLALGIVSFAIVAILGLFPVAMSSAKDSRQDTHAAFVVQSILGQIRSQSPTNTSFQVGTSVTTDSQSLSLATAAKYYVACDEYGQPISLGSSSQYTNGGGPSTAVYQAEIDIVPQTSPNLGLSKVTVSVGYPANAPLASRKTSVFATYLRATP